MPRPTLDEIFKGTNTATPQRPSLDEIFGKQPTMQFGGGETRGAGGGASWADKKPTFYSEVVSPVLSGASTFAMGIPKMAAKADIPGVYEAMYPEQQTILGKIIRGVAETAGFTLGIPGRAASAVGKGIMAATERGLARKILPAVARRIMSGAAAGAAGGYLSGSDTDERERLAKTGAILGGAIPAGNQLLKTGFNKIGRVGSAVSGIEKEIYDEAAEKGFRNVLQNKYYNKKLPSQIQERIANNIDNMEISAGKTYDKLVEPLKKTPFDMPQFRGDVIKAANRVKTNPFKTDASKIDKAILDGVVNKANANNLGDALDLRRNLDDIIYSNNGELKTSFGKQVRDILNNELHKNKELAGVDKEWSSFIKVLKESKKVLGDTGEKILDRFGKMTEKQKQMMIALEKKTGGEPWVEDLVNYSLAKDFITKKLSPSIPGLIKASARPILRSYLRKGEKAVNAIDALEKNTVGRFIGN